MTSLLTRSGDVMVPELLATCLLLSLLPGAHAGDVIVETGYGRIRGVSSTLAVSFRGVPYARPPVGALRWTLPLPPNAWAPNILDADQDPPGCPQIGCEPQYLCPKTTSEDCLYMNIFTPLLAKNGSNLPVMVNIHGGNFFFMSGASPIFDGEVFVQRGNVILVNINYRLGALGFLVTGSRQEDARGNYGLYDQIEALKWIRDNIRSFGGNPNQVTLFGQSAGAQSTLQHMTSAESADLFHKVIIESSPIALPYKTYAEAFVLGGLLAEALGCQVEDVTCLRSRSADDVAKAAFDTRAKVASLKFLEMFEPFNPYIDGQLVTGQPLDVYSRGEFSRKPMVVGNTREETVLYIYGSYNKSMDIEDYLALIGVTRPGQLLQIVQHYPPTASSRDQREVLVNISTDLVFKCPTRNLTRTALTRGLQDVWFYVFDHALSFPGWGPATYCNGRACHGVEVVYVFHTAYLANFTFTPDEELLSSSMMTYWTNFAWTGDPNRQPAGWLPARPRDLQPARRRPTKPEVVRSGQSDVSLFEILQPGGRGGGVTCAADVLEWPRYSSTTGWQAMYFQTPVNRIVSNYNDKLCTFWDGIGYGRVR
ncbi:cAMP-regulated D2 protein-like [Physella acuta]|uniref:cAMP-regulated D2 protein-like n=1 Tax=Physella acuta TaxID=109671 RepID=UPI0027DCD780|nr:cAMP-regulated D2 protein-like [Physella acuta]XP_059164847.1 cAMP-regulated D2 protein-like [Physella acuta]XP_059164848.1 cAMP-regulated D2 protein-like [Physella acuta]XP_059164849.1 cAMP-regulated D2 protein-like [Physella acuta]